MTIKIKRPPLTKRGQRLLTFIQGYQQAHGYTPSIREIMRGLQLSSTSVVNYRIAELVKLGYLKRGGKGVARSLVIVGSARTVTASSTGVIRVDGLIPGVQYEVTVREVER